MSEIEKLLAAAHESIEQAAEWWRDLAASGREPRPTADDLRAEIAAQIEIALEPPSDRGGAA